MVDGRKEDGSYDVKFFAIGNCWMFESLMMVAVFLMVWCVIFFLCASCTLCYGRWGVVQLKELH